MKFNLRFNCYLSARAEQTKKQPNETEILCKRCYAFEYHVDSVLLSPNAFVTKIRIEYHNFVNVCAICQRFDGKPHNEPENWYSLMNADANSIKWYNGKYEMIFFLDSKLRLCVCVCVCYAICLRKLSIFFSDSVKNVAGSLLMQSTSMNQCKCPFKSGSTSWFPNHT